MSNGIIARILPVAAIDANGTAGINAAFPATNMIDIQPKTVVQTNVTAAANHDLSFSIDLGADVQFDVFAVLFTNLSAAASWEVYGNLASAGGYDAGSAVTLANGAFGVAPTVRLGRRHALWLGASPVTFRYLRVFVNETNANVEQLIRAGVVVVGKTVPLAWNYELGSGRKVEDQSITRVLPGGETAIEGGGRTPVWRATWSNITDAEMRGVWSLLQELGTGAPLIICEDPDATTGLNERIHYGLLTGLDFTERTQADKQRIDLTIREMI